MADQITAPDKPQKDPADPQAAGPTVTLRFDGIYQFPPIKAQPVRIRNFSNSGKMAW